MAARLQLADGDQVFAKGIPADHALAGKYQAEARTALPDIAPAPRLRWDAVIGGWIVLVFDDVAGRHADLPPGSSDVARVVAMVGGLASVLTPCPAPKVPAAAAELSDMVHGWRELAASPPADLNGWARRNLDRLARTETAWLTAADGDTLLHGDINRSNLLVTDDEVYLVDWAQPVRGAPWLDLADLIPHLILAGHTPPAAEQAVAPAITATGVSAQTITSYAIAFAGYWSRTSRDPAPPDVPNLRKYQARAAHAALTWAAHRTRWS
ncbi:phosphotransferase family protein [Actinomadura xylanilytica]|uniref:phosphotransferase family protein n=1 Tax=Actinomadura xylanilytica TaxID=887459 RepID=UPI00255AE3C2|nr:phosphotransferase [Actinomadura xylanilytica]MDL4774267.1 phosphotransferase [Actinomadura xylanilytica]